MVKYTMVWNPKTERMEKRKTYKKPEGFTNFTDYSKKGVKDYKKAGYNVKVGRNPYSGKGGKVLFYKKNRKKRM